MKPILVFAIVAIAAGTIGVGALSNPIALTIQDFGVGSGDIVSPITSANIDFTIEAIPSSDGTEIKNLITACSFHSDESVNGTARIICKLTDIDSKVVAEGELLLAGYTASTTENVPITLLAFNGSNAVSNIHDVTLIVVGQSPTP